MHRRTTSRTKDADKPTCANMVTTGKKCPRGRNRATERCTRGMCRWCCAELGGCSAVPDHRVVSRQSVRSASTSISNTSIPSQPPLPLVPPPESTAPEIALIDVPLAESVPPMPPAPPLLLLPTIQPTVSTVEGEPDIARPRSLPPLLATGAPATTPSNGVVSVFAPINPRIGELRDIRVAQHLAAEAQMQEERKAQEEEERTGVVWLWTQANKDPRVISVDVINWPNLRVQQQEELRRALPPDTTDVEIFSPALGAWVQHGLMKIFKMPTRKSKEEPTPPVLMRIFPDGPQGDSFRDDDLPQLPAYARIKATHPRAVNVDIDEPPTKRARLAGSTSSVDAVLGTLPVVAAPTPIGINSSPTPASCTPTAPSPSSQSTASSLDHITPSVAKTLQNQFPSIFYFCFVWRLCSSINACRQETPVTISWDQLLASFEVPGHPSLRLPHSSYNRILSDFRKGTPALWTHFLQLGRDPAATISEYRKMLGPSAKAITSLPWEAGSSLDASKYTCICHSVYETDAAATLETVNSDITLLDNLMKACKRDRQWIVGSSAVFLK